MGVINFSHGSFFMFGAYFMFTFALDDRVSGPADPRFGGVSGRPAGHAVRNGARSPALRTTARIYAAVDVRHGVDLHADRARALGRRRRTRRDTVVLRKLDHDRKLRGAVLSRRLLSAADDRYPCRRVAPDQQNERRDDHSSRHARRRNGQGTGHQHAGDVHAGLRDRIADGRARRTCLAAPL